MKQESRIPPLPHLDTLVRPDEPGLVRLRELLRAFTPYDGVFDLRVAGVHASRSSQPNQELVHAVYRPALCIVGQGAKSVQLGPDLYEYDSSRLLVYAIDLPVATQVTRASKEEPFLVLVIDLEPARIAELTLKAYPNGLPRVSDNRGVSVSQVSTGIVNAAVRLLEAMSHQREAELIGPLIVDEILLRLLLSPIGVSVAQLGHAESSVHRIAKVVEWLREHFDEPISGEELAAMVHMSVSTFHAHFKAVTSMSPLQYQKVLRLQEARRLMVSTPVDASTAGRRVGYSSASQFSREYSRLFGRAPSRDVALLREKGANPGVI